MELKLIIDEKSLATLTALAEAFKDFNQSIDKAEKIMIGTDVKFQPPETDDVITHVSTKPAKVKKPTIEMVRKELNAYAKKHGFKKAKEIVSDHGADNATDLRADVYEKVIAACQA